LLTETDFVLPQALGETVIPVTSTFARRLCTLKEDSLAHVAYVLTQTQGDRQKTAEILGITIRQIQRKIALMKKDDKWKKIINDI
jgi:DNA-binding NtrC family response regulator